MVRSEFKSLYKKLGLNIAYYRKLRGLTQEALAEKIGVDPVSYTHLDVYKRQP